MTLLNLRAAAVLGSIALATSAFAAHLTTTNAQNTGQSWTNVIWRVNGQGAPQAPAPGNTYELVSNGVAYGNNLENTRVRNPLVSGLLPFPGDSLRLNPHTDIELKRAGTGRVPTVLFAGVDSGPGLILDGGSITVDDDEVFTVTGRVAVLSQSYIATGEDGGGVLRPSRALILAADLTGSGNLVWFQGGTNRAQQVAGNNAAYTGTWVIKAGWLQVTKSSAMAANNVLIDPAFKLPLSPTIVDIAGPAYFEPSVDIITSGTLWITNGGGLILHQNCSVASAVIEGIPFGPGRHTYADLAAAFPRNISPTGSGSLTIQTLGGMLPITPRFTAQPPPSLDAEPGGTVLLSGTATGTLPISYRWEVKQNGNFVPLSDGGSYSGTRTRTLAILNAPLQDSTEFRLVANNMAGTATSQSALLRVVEPNFPEITSVTPAAGSILGSFSTLQITFNRHVAGVDAEDLLINGVPASGVAGSGSTYLFSFSQPAIGGVRVLWNAEAGITDFAGKPFLLPPSWNYTVADLAPPSLEKTAPAAGSAVTQFSEAQLMFSEPVLGVNSSDLLANGRQAISLNGSGAGPYVFRFDPLTNTAIQLAWSPSHGIQDIAGNAFDGPGWALANDFQNAYKGVRINEILCASASPAALADEDGERVDWFEIRNTSQFDINLGGWSLTDDPGTPGKWTFPVTNLGPGQFLLIFASGKDRRGPGGLLHTNFKLRSSGGYLGLFQGNVPPIPVHAVQYGEQRNDISYGYDLNWEPKYFAQPTPGAPNSNSALTGITDPVRMSIEPGFFREPFNLVLACPTPNALIVYTTDGSIPSVSNGVTNGTVYNGPLRIAKTTPLRAVAFSALRLPSTISSRTFLFVGDIVRQPNAPAGYPVGNVWTPTPGVNQNGARAYYEMDPDIVNNPRYADRVRQGLLSIPALSIQMPIPDLFDPFSGIYTHPESRGPAWERACSMELIYPSLRKGVQVDSSIQIQGGTQREPGKNPKHSFRLNFKDEYGPSKLDFPLFPDSQVREFDRLVLDGGINLWWHYVGGNAPLDQRNRAQGVRDQFTSDLMNAMGHPSFHGRFFNLFLNGLYWGLHYVHEQPDESFAAQYFGGSPEDYDVIRNTTTMAPQVLSGDLTAWNTVMALATSALTNHSRYAEIQSLVDLENFIDYMILNHWTANSDWPHHNWYVIRKREEGAGFKFMVWDAEHTLKNVNDTAKFALTDSGTPAQLFTALTNNPEFRVRFADHVQKHLFNGGVLYTDPTPSRAVWDPAHPERNVPASYYMRRIQEIDTAIVAESARWGGYLINTNYTRDDHWIRELHNLLGYTNTPGNTANFFPLRSGVVLNKYRSMGLWPTVQAPAFSKHGGQVPPGFALSMTNGNGVGKLYYTLNGEDPRVFGGGISSAAQLYTNGQPVRLAGSVVAKARVLVGTSWSPLIQAMFTMGSGSGLHITEIMYNPPGGGAYEFIELQNLAASPIDLSKWHFEGVNFTFRSGSTLPPQGIIVLASGADSAAFEARYPGVIVGGYYSGSLANEGERLALLDADDRVVVSVEFDNGGGWPLQADGRGSSLELNNLAGEPDAPASWAASPQPNGSPGRPNSPPPSSPVSLNELMAENGGWVENSGTYPDWVELANTSSQTVSIAGWSLSDNANARKFVFPSGAQLAPGEHLLVWCDTNSAATGFHSGFSLEASGEDIFLYDEQTNRMDAVSFGQQLPGYTLARLGLDNTWDLGIVTPGRENEAATLAPKSALIINEWLANPSPGGADFVELYNSSATAPAALHGLTLSGSNGVAQLRWPSFIPPGGYAVLWADESSGPRHLDIKFRAEGDAIALSDAYGTLLGQVQISNLGEGISEGHLPDGTGEIVRFSGSLSPGFANYVPIGGNLALSEVLAARSSEGLLNTFESDWAELFNPGPSEINLDEYVLAKGRDASKGWRLPPLKLQVGSYFIVRLDGSKPASAVSTNAGFSLSRQGDALFLLSTNNHVVDSVSFGPQSDDFTIGRDATGWNLLQQPTPGAANSDAATLASPTALRINEWLADNAAGADWFELFNTASKPVALSGLVLTDDPSIFSLTNRPIVALSYIGPGQWTLFKADGKAGDEADQVSFALDRDAGSIRLYSADGDLLDVVDYALQTPGVSEGRLPDGTGAAISFVGTPTPGWANATSTSDADRDGLPDFWETVSGLNARSAEGPFGAEGDPDQDGLSNLQEFIAGTSPLDDSSRLRFEALQLTSGRLRMLFEAAPGRSYSIQYRTSHDSVWRKLLDVAPRPTAEEVEVLDTDLSGSGRYYRIVTPAQ